MDVPGPAGAAAAAAALAGFVRARLADLGGTVGATIAPITPRWARPDEMHDAVHEAAHQVAMLIAGAAAPFAPTSYARARLLRQLHAAGLLNEHESEQAVALLEIAQ